MLDERRKPVRFDLSKRIGSVGRSGSRERSRMLPPNGYEDFAARGVGRRPAAATSS